MSGEEYPKWVVAHKSHIHVTTWPNGAKHITTPDWPEFHINRIDGIVSVLVNTAEEAARATAEKIAEEVAPATTEESE